MGHPQFSGFLGERVVKTDHTDEDKVPLIRGWSVGEKPRGARVGRSHWPCQASWISFEARNLYLTFDWLLAWSQVNGYT